MTAHMLMIEELHYQAADPRRMDIGHSALVTAFATGGKRNIQLVLTNHLISNLPPEILGNLGCRMITRLSNPRCIAVAQHFMGLTFGQSEKPASLQERQIIVQYIDHATPFLVRVDEVILPPRPAEAELQRLAQAFLATVAYGEDALRAQPSSGDVAPAPRPPDALSGDALRVFCRLASHPAESITDRCDALGMDRPTELRGRRPPEAKGLIAKDEQTLGRGVQFYRITAKGEQWAQRHGIKVRRPKSGPVHEYILTRFETILGATDQRLRFQRNSPIAREHGLQPDTVANLPEDKRMIAEVCCNNMNYEARNLLREAGIDGVDLVVAIAPNQRARQALARAVERHRPPDEPGAHLAPLVLLDAGECLTPDFDWATVLAKAHPETGS